MRKRKTDFVFNDFKIIKLDQLHEIMKESKKKVVFRYLLHPKKIDDNEITMYRTSLKGKPFEQVAQIKEEDKLHSIVFDTLIVSAGF